MVSHPFYDPNALSSHDAAKIRAAMDTLRTDKDDPLLNRAIAQRYPPGSTFKIVTAAAALESGRYQPDTVVPGPAVLDLLAALGLFNVAGIGGNIAGYEIGRAIGTPLYERDGRILKKKYFDQTSAFFEKHGNKALVIGRFVPFVRTYITVVAGVSKMERHRFITWSLVGAIGWVLSITLAGYFLGGVFPSLGENIDKAIIVILAFSVIPVAFEWWRHKRSSRAKV
jgi:membrane protein DedA with SNARE-associated domain